MNDFSFKGLQIDGDLMFHIVESEPEASMSVTLNNLLICDFSQTFF